MKINKRGCLMQPIYNDVLSLPSDCQLFIFSFNTKKELLTSGEVCQKWNQLSGENSLWETFYPQLQKLGPEITNIRSYVIKMKLQDIVSLQVLLENYQEFLNILDFKANFMFSCVFPLNPTCSLTVTNKVTDLGSAVEKVYMLSEPLLTHPEFENQVKDYNVKYKEVPFTVAFRHPFNSFQSKVLINLFVRMPKVKRDNYVIQNNAYPTSSHSMKSFFHAMDVIDLKEHMKILHNSTPYVGNLKLFEVYKEENTAHSPKFKWDFSDEW